MTRIWLIIFAIVTAILGGVAWLSSPLWFGGITPMQTAKILIEDRKFGGRALGAANRWGDQILDPLREVSEDFRRIDNRNAFWVAEFLAKNDSRRCNELSVELYKRDALRQKLVGAIGLAGQGKLPKDEFLQGGIFHRIIVSDDSIFRVSPDGSKSYVDTALLELTLVAAKYARSVDSVTGIIALIEKMPRPYWVHANAADALAAIGDQRAVLPLEAAMQSPNFYALPNAFRALVALQDERAVPLAINRISPEIKGKNAGGIVRELETVTGKRFGFDQARWQEWWDSKPVSSKKH